MFDSKETEDFYYSKMKELGITHISLYRNKIYTMDDVIEIFDEIEKYSDQDN